MTDKVLYSDSLVKIDERSLLVRDYYYPFGSKKMDFADIASVTVMDPTLWTGKYRIYGTGDFRTWSAPDSRRPSRDKIFVARLRGKWWRVGFTVENTTAVTDILEKKCRLIRQGQNR